MLIKWFRFALALSLSFSATACLNKKKESPYIAGEVEEAFKARWIAKRMTELQASGEVPDPREARQKATEEFKKRYEYTSAAQKADPMSGSTP